MQKRHWLVAALVVTLAPVGCAGVQEALGGDGETERTERTERDETRRTERRERRDDDELARRQEAREEARREARREQRDEQREARRDRRLPRSPQEARRPPAADYIADNRCPVAMRGVDVTAVDTGSGGALEFRARDRDDARQVRDRVRGLMRETEEGAEGGRFDPLTADQVRYERTEEGARLVFNARGDDAILDLRSELEQRADMLRSDERCERGIVSMR